ncbi:MAG TPA: PorP/SprF family type IX secretion system membrane protein [Flavipsychrobacter sp.]|nr:PorP/SprF family type IX secretion system membrane protein [Flavipsychrobacter sp.]
MRKLFYKIIAGVFSLLLPAGVMAQADIHFSQFYEMSILRNPALTGVFTDDYKAGVLYRNQWSSISNPFQTALVNGEFRIPIGKNVTDFLSVGLLAYYDKAGSIDQQIMGVYPAVNYNKSLEDDHHSFLSVGFTGGYLQYSFDPGKATFNNQFQNGAFNSGNPTGENLPNPKVTIWDMGAGVNFNSSANDNVSYMFGAGGYHFTEPVNSYYRNPDIKLSMRWNINAALSAKINDYFSLQLQGNYALEGNYNEVVFGGLVGWTKPAAIGVDLFTIYAGVFYRAGDAIIPVVKVKYKDMAFGLSYDANISSLKAATNLRGGYEVSVFKTGVFHTSDNGKTICPTNFY